MTHHLATSKEFIAAADVLTRYASQELVRGNPEGSAKLLLLAEEYREQGKLLDALERSVAMRVRPVEERRRRAAARMRLRVVRQ